MRFVQRQGNQVGGPLRRQSSADQRHQGVDIEPTAIDCRRIDFVYPAQAFNGDAVNMRERLLGGVDALAILPIKLVSRRFYRAFGAIFISAFQL